MGISEACYIPAALALITEYHLGPTRSRAVGIHQMGIYTGVITGSFAGYLAEAPGLGWRSGFAACGIIGMLYALPLLWLLSRAAAPENSATLVKSISFQHDDARTVHERLVHSARPLLHAAGVSLRGWCAIGCRQFCKRNSTSSRASRGSPQSCGGRARPS
jgi:MFS family permease